jgi:ComF family protein
MKPADFLLSLIAPNHCINCSVEGQFCCQNCLEEIKLKHNSKVCYKCSAKSSFAVQKGICKNCLKLQNLDSINWYSDYKNKIASSLIKDLKFNNKYSASHPISAGIQSCFRELSLAKGANIIVTAIPTANKRVRRRGWDQAKLIAKTYAKSEKLVYKSLLVRSSSFDQIGASKHQRFLASKKFFKPIRPSLIKGSAIILVDDVVTTGSTLDSAAKILKSAGAKEVHAITFARQGLSRKTKT